MNECDILGIKTYSDPCYIFSGGRTPNPPLFGYTVFSFCLNDSWCSVKMFDVLGTVVYAVMSADASCLGLRSPRDGPLVMEWTQGAHAASCLESVPFVNHHSELMLTSLVANETSPAAIWKCSVGSAQRGFTNLGAPHSVMNFFLALDTFLARGQIIIITLPR